MIVQYLSLSLACKLHKGLVIVFFKHSFTSKI